MRQVVRATSRRVGKGVIQGFSWVGKQPAAKRVGGAISRGWKRYGEVADAAEAHIGAAIKRGTVWVRQQKVEAFVTGALSVSVVKGQAIEVGSALAGKRARLDRGRIEALGSAFQPLVRSLHNYDIRVTTTDGKSRALNAGDVTLALEMLQRLSAVAAENPMVLPSGDVSFQTLLADRRVAASLLRTAEEKSGRSWSTQQKQAFLESVVAVRSTFEALGKVYQLFVRWPGVKSDKIVEKLCSGVDEKTLVVVGSAAYPPRQVKRVVDELVNKYLKRVGSLFLDPLLSGDAAAEQTLREKLPALLPPKDQRRVRELLTTIVRYRDQTVAPVIAIRGGERVTKVEQQVRDRLGEEVREAARHAVKTDFLKGRSEGSREAFLKVFLPVLTATTLLKALSEHVPFFGQLMPVVAGCGDDLAGIAPNLRGMKDNKADVAELQKQGIKAGAFAVASSASLAVSAPGARSTAEVMFDPAAGVLGYAASGVYGVLSSGGSLWMGFKGAKYHEARIAKLIEEGLVDPKDRHGRSIKNDPKALKKWIKRKAFREHVGYDPVQFAGLTGAALSGVAAMVVYGLTAGTWGGWLAPLWLNLVGAGESVFTAGVLWGGEAWGRSSSKRAFRRTLRSVSDGL